MTPFYHKAETERRIGKALLKEERELFPRHPVQQGQEVGLKQGMGGKLSGVNHQGEIVANGRMFRLGHESAIVQPEDLLHLPPDTVALDGIAELARRNDDETVVSQAVGDD